MSDKQSSKNGAKATWHAKNDDKRREDARKQIAEINRRDAESGKGSE